VFTHGSKLLAGYLKKLRGGGYPPGAAPRIEREGPAWAIVDGDAGLGQIGCHFALQTAMQKAGSLGVAFVALRNTGHIGAAGHFAAKAARSGFIAMITGNDMPSVAAPGSERRCSAQSISLCNSNQWQSDSAGHGDFGRRGRQGLCRAYPGEPIPPTWLIGPDGHPTTDGSLYPHVAALAPMAGHKGYGWDCGVKFYRR